MNLSARSSEKESIRGVIKITDKRFDVSTIPMDMQRVFYHLKEKYGEEYGLYFVFTMRTAIELHRAWHMSLLTSKILQQIKDKFGLIMTWELGVLKLKFRVDDGGYELHRKVPYDYDSEYQDIYMRIAIALIEEQINIHEALIYQSETKQGVHTARSGIFLRDFPGRLVLYPFESATCAIIFFGGDLADAGVAAICGFTAGLFEYMITTIGGDLKILVDTVVGISTGIIGGLFYERAGRAFCLPSIFLGTLYWYFYGTAFVIGLLEIIAGELETGVTRFIAVAVKTFVLSLGAGIGLLITTTSGATDAWFDSQDQACDVYGDLSDRWWRIPLYLLCSISVLGQYRLPIVQYSRGLVVMLVAYEVQYKTSLWLAANHQRDYLDTSASNILGAATGVVSACLLSWILNQLKAFHTARLLQENDGNHTRLGDLLFKVVNFFIRVSNCIGIGRKSDFLKLKVGEKLKKQMRELKDPSDQRQEIDLLPTEQNLILEAIVGSQELNVWSILMPALYQLVPGSIIARLWFNSIFPPLNIGEIDSVFSNLMVISASLSLGLIIGFVTVQCVGSLFWNLLCGDKSGSHKEVVLGRLAGMYSVPLRSEDDPDAKQKTDQLESRQSDVVEETDAAKKVAKEVSSYFPVSSLDDEESKVESQIEPLVEGKSGELAQITETESKSLELEVKDA